MKAVTKIETVYSDTINKNQVNASLQQQRKQEVFKIKNLLKKGYEPEFSSKNNWFRLGGETFNGYTREQVEKMQSEVYDEE